MADNEYRRRREGEGSQAMGWILGLLGLVALGLIIWWAWPNTTDEMDLGVTDPAAPGIEEPRTDPQLGGDPQAPPTTGAQSDMEQQARTAEFSVTDILDNPETYSGESFSGEIQVSETPMERAFWAEDQGRRILVVLSETPEEPLQMEAGESIRITDAEVHTSTEEPDLEELGPEVRTLLQQEEAYLIVDQDDLSPSQGAMPGQQPEQPQGQDPEQPQGQEPGAQTPETPESPQPQGAGTP